MGGQEGKYFKQFCKLSIEAYKQLRRNAVLIMSLLRLMKDAGIDALQVCERVRACASVCEHVCEYVCLFPRLFMKGAGIDALQVCERVRACV